MDTYIYLIVALVAVLTILVIVFFVLLLNREKNNSNWGSVYGSGGGVNVDLGQKNGEEIHGYRGIMNTLTYVRQGIHASVYLEESLTANQFRADLGGPVVIGRLVTGGSMGMNNLSVSTSSFLSRQHAQLKEIGGVIYIENLSKFGTKVNGIDILQPTPLYQGDIIIMGDVQLRVLGIDFYRT